LKEKQTFIVFNRGVSKNHFSRRTFTSYISL